MPMPRIRSSPVNRPRVAVLPSIPPAPGANPLLGGEAFAQLRERILHNPNDLEPILQDIQTSNPELYQTIQQNPQIIQQLIMNPGRPPAPPQPPAGSQFSAEERASIDRVFGLDNE